jgi:hypothetical protein
MRDVTLPGLLGALLFTALLCYGLAFLVRVANDALAQTATQAPAGPPWNQREAK